MPRTATIKLHNNVRIAHNYLLMNAIQSLCYTVRTCLQRIMLM